MRILRPYQNNAVGSILTEFEKLRSTLLVLATGLGKCLGRGTLVLMFDGTIQPVETIQVGDLLMGPDSQPRLVTSTTSGIGELYQVKPVKGEPYVVNDAHILCLKITTGDRRHPGKIIDISIGEYLSANKTFKHCAKGWRTAVEWPARSVPLPPYYIGLWLGDGTAIDPSVSKPDPEIETYMMEMAVRYGLKFHKRQQRGKCPTYSLTTWKRGGTTNPVTAQLRALNLIENKHVPIIYKANCKSVRQAVLAGLMDSDGCKTNGGYDYISVSQRLAEDVAFLARSLGLAAYIRPCRKGCQNGFVGDYWRVQISGDCSDLPMRIPRKISPVRRQKKDVLVTGITVSHWALGSYYGFTLSGDGRFLLGDFTVTHNTAVASMVIKAIHERGGRTLFLAHTDELIMQGVKSIIDWTGLDVQIEKAEQYAELDLFHRKPIIVSSIQTQISGKPGQRRYLRFKPTDFDLVVCDEAHMSVAKSWREVLAHYQQNPKLKVLGLTATPKRTDEKAMGQVYESVAMQYGILDGIADGYLVDIVQQRVPVSGLDFSHIKTTGGDLNEGQLAAVMEQENNVQEICQPIIEAMFGLEPKALHAIAPTGWKEYLRSLNRVPRRTLIYTVSVAQAELCCNVFRRALDGVEWLCGKTNKDVRRKMVERFFEGATHGLVNVGCLTHGFDNAYVELIGMARPTKSTSLYLQILGRGTRTLPGVIDGLDTAEARRAAIAASAKPFIRLMDFKGNAGHHKIVSCVDVLGGKVSAEAAERAGKKMDDGKPRKILLTMSNAEIDLERERREEEKRREQEALARRQHLLARVDYSVQTVGNNSGHVSPLPRPVSRDGRCFSDRQAKVLREGGIDPRSIKYRNGVGIIAKLVQQPSVAQRRLLIKHGYNPDGMSRKEAHKTIDALAANGWRRPPEPEPISAGQAARLEVAGKEPF